MPYVIDRQKLLTQAPSFSIVVETENLGMAGLEDLKHSLDSLKNQTFPVEKSEGVFIISAGHVSEATLASLQAEYPWLKIHEEPRKLRYTQAKMLGAQLAKTEVVIFADSDVIYENTWLENILNVFLSAPGADVVAGDTCIKVYSIYRMAIQLAWMLNTDSGLEFPKPAKNFYLNNFSIRRSVMLATPFFEGLPLYRSSLSEWIKQLKYHGYSIMRAPKALGYHAPPGSLVDWWYRMLILGADTVAKADFHFTPDGTVSEKFSPLGRVRNLFLLVFFRLGKMFMRICLILRRRFAQLGYIILALPVAILSVLVMTLGGIVALFDRDLIFKNISRREGEHVV
jgi:glycosyltransferase involved in cell wall biosynthesis